MKTLFLKRNDGKVVICLTGKNPQRHYEQVLKPRGFEPCTQVEYDTIRKEIAEREVCPTMPAPDAGESAPLQAESTPEHLPIEEADTTSALRT